MTPIVFCMLALVFSFAGGLLGSLVGVGGGIIVVPALTQLLGVDIRYAIGASIVAVIATSSGAAISYVRDSLTNLRLAMVLEVATAAGAICGAVAAPHVAKRWLYILFGGILLYTSLSMLRKRIARPADAPRDPLAERLRLHHRYFDEQKQQEIEYHVHGVKLGFGVSYVAGIVSGLLGVGGGVLKVPVMNRGMGVPLKVCSATSNFMIGVTAAASAAIYFMNGLVLPTIAAPIAIGVLGGATVGARVLGKSKSNTIRWLFVAVLVFTAGKMLWQGVRS